jgi:hypothetical protein
MPDEMADDLPNENAGSNLDKAQLFAEAVKHRPRIRLTIRQRTRVLQQWPRHKTLL